MLKKDLRSKYFQLRRKIDSETISTQSVLVANKILKIPIWDFSFFHIFLSIETKYEIDSQPILSILQGHDKNIVVPKIISSTQLEHILLLDNTLLKLNKWNIPEPVDGISIPATKLDVVFIPLLAFDNKGNRVGYGKGFYDRFLETCRPDIVKIGLSLFEAEESITDCTPQDIPLDYCITPEKIYAF